MKPLLTPAQMYALEARHFAAGMSSLDAMEQAAAAFADELIRFCTSVSGKRICVACGSGNNGGDGYAAARLLSQKGAEVSLLALTEWQRLPKDALINARRSIFEFNLPLLSPHALDGIPRPDIWVDAIFGIGLNRPVSDAVLPVINRIAHDRALGSIVASMDIPSGLDAESGLIQGQAVRADLTVTFQHPKTGHFLLDGMDCCGKLCVRDIGLNRFAPENTAFLIEPSDPRAAFPPRLHNTHKGTYGHLLVAAGSLGMAGAAAYTAHAALRSGAGLVSVACPRSVVPVMQTILPAAMCIPLPEKDGAVSAEAYPIIREALRGKSAAAVGPGLSMRADPSVVRAVLECGLPAVVDADALNLIAVNPSLERLLAPHHVLTPHPGEARRLCADCTGHALEDVHLLHTLNAIVLLKGAASVICGQRTCLSTSGSPGMAVGGSGDVLTGILGAMLARGIPAEDAACWASEIHGRCGKLAEEIIPPACMTASDLIDQLPYAVKELL